MKSLLAQDNIYWPLASGQVLNDTLQWFRGIKLILIQESPPAGSRKKHTARGVTSPGWRGGGPVPAEGLPLSWGTPPPPRQELWQDCGTPLERTCRTCWKGTWDQKMKYPPPPNTHLWKQPPIVLRTRAVTTVLSLSIRFRPFETVIGIILKESFGIVVLFWCSWSTE